MNLKKSIKTIAIMLIVTFTVTMAIPADQLAYNIAYAKSVENIKQTKANIKYETPTNSTSLGSFADTLLEKIEAIKLSIEQGDAAKLKEQVKDTNKLLKDIRKSVQKELDENGSTLDKLNAVNAKKKHDQFKDELQGKLDTFEGLFNQLDELSISLNDLKGKESDAFKNKLEEIEKVLNPEQPQQPLGALPYNNANIAPKEPAIGGGISPAYAGGAQTASVEQVLPKTPVDADLEQIPETMLTQEIKDLADSLNTPLKIYEYVRNNIAFEPYFGSRKGAEGTLNQMVGNDYDQASLLISMLRYKGIPSRYVKGTIEVPIEKVKGWTGVQDPNAAVRVMASLGVPTVSVISGGTIVAARFEHTWAEAYVPYEYYRGAGEMKGQKAWIPLDPSFKQSSYEAGLDIKAITGVTNEQILDAFKINAEKSADGDTITNVNIDKLSSFLDSSTEKLQQYLKDNNLENADAKQLMGGKKIIAVNLGLLPNTLPYKTVTVLSETNTVPLSSSEKIGFSIRGSDPFNLNFSGTDDFNAEFRAVELYGKRITLSWVPNSQEDINIINNYGGLFNTPSYMVQLKPQVKADGKVLAEGKAVNFGYRQEFTISMGHAGMPVENISNPVTAGGIYSIIFDFGNIDTKELGKIKDRLSQVTSNATEENIYTDEVMGEILNSVGKAYFGQLDGIDTIAANASKVVSLRQVSEAMTGYGLKVKYMFGVPVGVAGGSFFIDVDHNVLGVTSLEGKKESETGYMINTGILASNMESGIHEQIFQIPSVSSIKVLTEASNRGIPIYTIGKHNMDKISQLNVSSSVKTDITNAVNSGKIVVIPQKEIRYYNWQGSGYIILDPETGAAAYMISGGLAGGSAALDIVVTLAALAGIIWAIIDTITIAMAFLAATNPIIAIVFLALFALSVYNIVATLETALAYWQTGDYKYAAQIMGDLLMNLAFMGAFKILEKILPGLMAIFKSIKNQMDTVADIAAKYGDEAAEMAARYGPDAINAITKYGDDALSAITKYGDDAINAIKNYGDDAVRLIKDYGNDAVQLINKYGDDAIKAITNYGGDALRAIRDYGDDALRAIDQYGAEAVEMITKYGDDAVRNITKYGEDGLIALYAYGDELIENIAKYGDDAVGSVIKYGDDAMNAMKNGIDPGLISRLDSLGLKPADLSRYNIVTKDTAETIADALANGAKLMNYVPTSGAILITTPGETTTILGRFGSDMGNIITELGIPKSFDFGPKPNGFNVLNCPDSAYVTPDQFWTDYNKPFLDEAIARGDQIIMATEPAGAALRNPDGTLTGLGREYEYLISQGYHYDSTLHKMIK